MSTDMFLPPAAQLDIVRQRNKERNWGFTEQDFANLAEQPAWPDKLSAVVLEVSLDTVHQTFEEAWHLAKSIQPNHWRWEELRSDQDNLRLLPGITHQRGLRWRVIDLAANWDTKQGVRPADVRDPKMSPHSAILWAASYFPKWVQAMDGTTAPFVWIPGYQVSVGLGRWASVPGLDLGRSNRGLCLGAADAHGRNECWAVPAFRE